MRARRDATGRAPAAMAVLMVLITAGTLSSHGHEILDCFSPAKQAAISSGHAVVDVVQVPEVDLAVIGAVRTTAGGDRLLAWFREIEQLQTGPHAQTVRRFSDPPQIADLSGFALDDQDLESLRECRPGRCDIKLSAGEIAAVQRALRAAGPRWKPAVQDAFRQLMLDRARAYLAGGLAAALPYEDHAGPVLPGRELQLLLHEWRPALVGGPAPPTYLPKREDGPRASSRESLLFWSTDRYDGAKPVFSITHASLVAGDGAGGPAVVTAVQVYANHYLTASVSLTAIVTEPGGPGYLVYSRRSSADVFRGSFGGWLRRVVRKRIGVEGPAAMDRLRTKLETGIPEPRHSR